MNKDKDARRAATATALFCRRTHLRILCALLTKVQSAPFFLSVERIIMPIPMPFAFTPTITMLSAVIAWMAWKSRTKLCIKCIDGIAQVKKYLDPPFCPEICLGVQHAFPCTVASTTVPLLPCVRELRMYDADNHEMDSAVLRFGIMGCKVCLQNAWTLKTDSAAPSNGSNPNATNGARVRVCLWSLLQEQWVKFISGHNLLQWCFSRHHPSDFPERIEVTLNDTVLGITGQKSIVEHTALEDGVKVKTATIVLTRGFWNNIVYP